jgi:uncharacterized protein YkwD
MPSLVLISEGKETRYALAGGAVVVGRSSEAGIQVSEARASREHFRLEPTERGWVVRDLGSSNGTSVNGYFVSRALLAPGDVIEVGGAAFRFDGDGPAPAARAPRPPRKAQSAGPAWIGAVVTVLAIAFISDVVAVGAARDANREIVDTTEKAAHALFLVAQRTQDPAESERLLREFVDAFPAHGDAGQARARLAALAGRRETRAAAAADWEAFAARADALSPAEYRWRLESLLRRWTDVPEALDEIRARASERKGAALPAEDARVLFLRRKREADAATAGGRPGRALAMWSAHALESPPVSADAEADLRAEVRRIEDLAATRAQEALNRAAVLRDEGRSLEAEQVLREAADALGETAGGARVRARLDAGAGPAGGRSPGSAGGGAPEATDEGYTRRRALVLRAREAEQFVALRDYGSAAGLYAGVAGDAAGLPDLSKEMGDRAAWLRRVADLLESLRTGEPQGWKGKPWPKSWEEVPATDLLAALQRGLKKPEDRLALASFCYDQALKDEARRAIAQALEAEATHADAERLYSAREGLPIPEGGFVADKGEIVTRDEFKRRRNAEAIAKSLKRQETVVRRLHETQVAKGIDRIRKMRVELDRRRASALELIFDEIKYFYPYQDRMGEYTPVQQDVSKRVEAVREIWDDKAKFRSKPDTAMITALKDYDEVSEELRTLGAAAGAAEKDVAALRAYLDRDLDVRTFNLDAAELALFERDRGVMAENAKRKAAAEESEARQVEITNEYRMMFGRRALLLEAKLVLAARAHGDDMSRGGFFSHFNEKLLGMKPGEKVPKQACGCSSDGFVPGCTHGPDARIRQQDYEFIACSENIHMGSGDPLGAHAGWIHSSGHHRNLLHSAWTEMGTGRVGRYWTQNFGLPTSAGDAAAEGAGSAPWDRAGGRGTGEDGNPPEGR